MEEDRPHGVVFHGDNPALDMVTHWTWGPMGSRGPIEAFWPMGPFLGSLFLGAKLWGGGKDPPELLAPERNFEAS